MDGVISDRTQVADLLKQGKITDIGAFLKDAARKHSDVVDPDEFDRKWDYDAGAAIVKDFAGREGEAIGSKRSELQEVLKDHESRLVDAFSEMTDKQKSYGSVASKLSFANGYDEVDKIFSWADIQLGPMSVREKCLSMLQAAQLIGTTPANYRGVRKMFLSIVAGNNIAIQPEWLVASDKAEATQKAVAAKLLKAESIEDVEACFDWAEVELRRQLPVADRYFVFFQVAEVAPLGEDHYRNLRKILCRMNKD